MQSGAAVIKHGADLAINIADYKIIAGIQRAILDQNRGHGTASTVEFGFEHHAGGSALRGGFQLRQIRDQTDHFQQQIQVSFLFRGNIHEHCLAAPIFRHQATVGQLLLDPVRHGFGLIDLVDGYDDWNFRGMRVVNGF